MRNRESFNALMVLLVIGTSTTLFAQSKTTTSQADPVFVVQVGRYRLQSNPWVNLHQRLVYEARFGASAPALGSESEMATWKRAVDEYRAFLGERNPVFDDGLIRLNASLSDTRSEKLPDSIPTSAKAALESSMPIYRAAQWKKDDRANRFWIAVAEPMLKSAAEELCDAHSMVYGAPFPKHILVDVSAYAWRFGAYTVGERDAAHSVISSTNPAYQGLAALEFLMHEPSHVIVGARSGAIGTELSQFGKEIGVDPRRNLWHAILFYTSGELTRRALAERGVADYKPFILGMYEGGFRGFKQPLETHWQAYLDGKITRESALRKILSDTAEPSM